MALFFAQKGDSRRTPSVPANVFQLLPELKKKEKVAVRLHPRRVVREPDPDESKLGGQFLWPAGDPWPVCEEHKHPYVTVLQLRKADVPELKFRRGTDLFQLLWCPHDHDQPWTWVKPKVFWRDSAAIDERSPDVPQQPDFDKADPPCWADLIPVPCMLMPERVSDLPRLHDPEFPQKSFYAPEESLEERLGMGIWALPGASPRGDEFLGRSLGLEFYRTARYAGMDYYNDALSTCPGTKVGGYAPWCNVPNVPTCSCGRTMEHLLSITGSELGATRWLPTEEQQIWDGLDQDQRNSIACPHGMLDLYDGDIYFFICRRCRDWPIMTECCG